MPTHLDPQRLHPHPCRALVLALLAAGVLAGCGGSSQPSCRFNADCASGICLSNGSCGVSGTGGGAGGGTSVGGGAGGGAGGGSSTDGGVGGGGGGAQDGGSDGSIPDSGVNPGCLPNRDGTLTRAEMPLGAGLHATFLVATNATFNSAGTPADGGYLWDLTLALSGDKSVRVDTVALAGTWFEARFPGASYYASISDTLFGVFEVAADGLYLQGVVSTSDSFYATDLKYTPPAKLLAFPMSAGTTWTTTSTVAGRYAGNAFYSQTEKYDSTVDKQGELATPFARFPVLRVKTVLTRTIGFSATVTRSFLFTTECFGTVGTMNSQANESGTEFTSSAEIRRLSP